MYSMAGLAEYAVVPATDVFALPAALPLAESSVLGCAVFTAFGAVRHSADLRGGERVAVVAAGGVGMNIIQIARAFGASQVIAIDVRDDKLQSARQHGATDVVNASKEDVTKQVKELTDGQGVDVAFEVLGRPETFVQAFEIIRDGGRMVAVGIAAGRTAAGVEITRLVRRGLRIIGSYGARTRADMPEIIRLAAAGVFHPETMITQRFPLAEADKAYQMLNRGEIVGRAIVLTPFLGVHRDQSRYAHELHPGAVASVHRHRDIANPQPRNRGGAGVGAHLSGTGRGEGRRGRPGGAR
jgi:S-(hydroxymethyl)glutathione dehydrogenase/alcohol dehydrogenase